ncbi:hypothetical protein JDV02_007118 [Purpureocillium takamizusanense]|uniref:RRM domain-containing protein n=1 Tax=Purpureocillium takamizusanense TaxID=2060973 RepID=A0A9Q8QHN0_9HYPO|nr:uncharacterized protein JDV02_007118 [Purpureocillium takamizusanense]UNI21099.1 hypothetical protein JDV02_007118 [Purpureocillium takamizusanense]
MDPPFPKNPEEFDADERISFSKLDSKFIAVHDDGTEFEFDAELKEWIPTGDDDLDDEPLDAEDYGGVTAPATAAADSHGAGAQKRKADTAEEASEGTETSRSAPPAKKSKGKAPPKPKENTAVYVTGLPADATVDEIHELFSRKCGIIAEEIDSGAPRIKLYTDDAGNFKGDALVVFFKPQSVRMALTLLDDSDFRVLPSGQGEGRIRVQEADSSYKRVKHNPEESGTSTPASQPGARRSAQGGGGGGDRQKVIRKTQKLDAKLADWSDEEDERFAAVAAEAAAVVPKGRKKVILRQMFRIFELEEDPASVLEIKEDIRDECSKLGTVTSVVLYDQEPEGIVTVKFKEPEGALRCVELMDGRNFDQRIVRAEIATGKEKFRKSAGGKDDDDSD